MIGFWVRLAVLWMVSGLVLRLTMAWLTPAGSFVDPSIGAWFQTFVFGTFSDAQALALICGWLSVGFLLSRRFAVWWIGLTMAVAAFIFMAEIFHWTAFYARLGITLVRYGRHLQEVVTFLQEQVGLGFYLIPLVAIGWAAARWMGRWLPSAISRRERFVSLAWLAAALVLFVNDGGYRAPVGPERSLNHLASNGWLDMLHAARVDLSEWDTAYWQPAQPEPPPIAATAGTASPTRFKHLLLIIEESFSGEAWWDLAQRRKYAPQLAAIAKKGIYFDRVYATGTHTVRGMEAILHGYPPLPGLATTQREGFERLPSLPRVLSGAGFHTTFVYGGWPNFTNFFDYWRGIGFDAMLSRYDFPDRWFETSWGVADEILFDRVLVEMDRRTARHDRVMLSTLTVTNHHPFDFPADRVPFPNDQRRQDYAVAYADWALGEFVREAQRRPWFEDTLLVVVADHGPLRPGPTLVPANHFRAPLVLYNPARLAPQSIEVMGSTMSLPVTLLSLLGVPATEPFYGRSLLAGEDQLAPAEEDYHVGVLGRGHLTVLARGGGLHGWRYDGQTLTLDQPDMAQARFAAALFGDAHRRFYGSGSGP
ncbi:MAG: LTA synthase family protein [Gammaproteobacteria bacterium]|nr:LTA synthase family protein [Gammaproteobacteria bacterium]MYE50333.1 LTA synthase family protein [Gammaproteobacteria bacterium]